MPTAMVRLAERARTFRAEELAERVFSLFLVVVILAVFFLIVDVRVCCVGRESTGLLESGWSETSDSLLLICRANSQLKPSLPRAPFRFNSLYVALSSYATSFSQDESITRSSNWIQRRVFERRHPPGLVAVLGGTE